jgi:hypothetical protein
MILEILTTDDTTYVGTAAAIADGTVAQITADPFTETARHGRHVLLVLEPLTVASSDGTKRGVAAGDVLSADEIEHAGSALARMIRTGKVARVPARGVVALGLIAAGVEF